MGLPSWAETKILWLCEKRCMVDTGVLLDVLSGDCSISLTPGDRNENIQFTCLDLRVVKKKICPLLRLRGMRV